MESTKTQTLATLDEFVKSPSKEIPKDLEEYLKYVASSGDPVFCWSLVKILFRQKMLNVIMDFFEASPIVDIPVNPNSDPFNFETVKTRLLERYDQFSGVPFTIQRIAELLTTPRKQYNRLDKYMRALEKNIWVVSTREPLRETNPTDRNNIMNGMLSSTSTVSPDRLKRQSESVDQEEVENTKILVDSGECPTEEQPKESTISENCDGSDQKDPTPAEEPPDSESQAEEVTVPATDPPLPDAVQVEDGKQPEDDEQKIVLEEAPVQDNDVSEAITEPIVENEAQDESESETLDVSGNATEVEVTEIEESPEEAENVESTVTGIVSEPSSEGEPDTSEERPDLKRKREETDDRDEVPKKKLETEVVIEDTEPELLLGDVNSGNGIAGEIVKEPIIEKDLSEETDKDEGEGEMMVEEPVDQAMDVDESNSVDVQSPMIQEESLEPMEASEASII